MKSKRPSSSNPSGSGANTGYAGLTGSVVFLSPGENNTLLSVTETFLRYTGYQRHEVLGHDLTFLCGPETSPEAIEMLRYLLRTGSAGQVKILNYRKDGTSFWHMCDLRPILNSEAEITHFICVLKLI